jgi:hypothetical protein
MESDAKVYVYNTEDTINEGGSVVLADQDTQFVIKNVIQPDLPISSVAFAGYETSAITGLVPAQYHVSSFNPTNGQTTVLTQGTGNSTFTAYKITARLDSNGFLKILMTDTNDYTRTVIAGVDICRRLVPPTTSLLARQSM